MKHGFFQVLSRRNDVNGNSYRLICVYNKDAELIELIQERDSRPIKVTRLVQGGYVELPSIHVSIAEYRSFVVGYRRLYKEE